MRKYETPIAFGSNTLHGKEWDIKPKR
jgi:hypothetical protein